MLVFTHLPKASGYGTNYIDSDFRCYCWMNIELFAHALTALQTQVIVSNVQVLIHGGASLQRYGSTDYSNATVFNASRNAAVELKNGTETC